MHFVETDTVKHFETQKFVNSIACMEWNPTSAFFPQPGLTWKCHKCNCQRVQQCAQGVIQRSLKEPMLQRLINSLPFVCHIHLAMLVQQLLRLLQEQIRTIQRMHECHEQWKRIEKSSCTAVEKPHNISMMFIDCIPLKSTPHLRQSGCSQNSFGPSGPLTCFRKPLLSSDNPGSAKADDMEGLFSCYVCWISSAVLKAVNCLDSWREHAKNCFDEPFQSINARDCVKGSCPRNEIWLVSFQCGNGHPILGEGWQSSLYGRSTLSIILLFISCKYWARKTSAKQHSVVQVTIHLKAKQSNALLTKAHFTKCPNFIEPSTCSLISFIVLLMLSDCWFSNDHNVFVKRSHQLLCLMEITNLRNSGFWVEKCIDPWSLRNPPK